MCGLIYVKRFNGKRVNKLVAQRYREQATRGQEGYGFVTLKGGKLSRFMKAESEKDILNSLYNGREDEVIFHHRKPTSTPNIAEAAHPIVVEHKSLKHRYYVIHNGVLHDTDFKLKAEHDKQGFSYSTLLKQYYLTANKKAHHTGAKWNDSETFAIELAKDLDGKQEGLAELSGTIAFIALQVDIETEKSVKLYYGRNHGSPLKVSKSNRLFQIASEGVGDEVKAHELNCFDYATSEITKKNYSVGITSYSNYGTGYKGYDNHSYGSGRSYDTEDDFVAKKDPIGFGSLGLGRSLPPPVAPVPTEKEKQDKQDQIMADIDAWMQDEDELTRVTDMIKWIRPDDREAESYLDTLMDRKLELEHSIKRYVEGNVKEVPIIGA